MVQIDRTDTSDGVEADATFIPLSGKKFPEKSSSVCPDDLNHLSILSNQQELHLYNEIPRAKGEQRQKLEALLTGKKDAWQNTDLSVLSSRSGQKQKTVKFAKWLHLLLGILGIVMAVTFLWTTYTPSKSIKMKTNIGFPMVLIEPCKRSVVSALGIVYQSTDETCQAGKCQKVIPAWPQVIIPQSIKLTEVNISKMLEDKGLGQWSSSVTRAIPPKDKGFDLRMPLYYQQCKSRFTLSITDGDEVKIDSGFNVQSRFDILHGFDTMGTCHMVRNQSWECRLLVALEALKKDLKAIPSRAYDKLLEDEYSKLKIMPGIFSDILKLLKVHFELENVITSRKIYKGSRGTASNNIFINVHLKCVYLWKTPQARAHKLPKLEGLSMNRRLLTEDVALDHGYYDEGSELEPGMEVLSHMVFPAIVFEPFSSPPFIKAREKVEDDLKGHSPASNFTHDFTSLGLQGDSSQRPARKAIKGSASGHEGQNNSGYFLQGLTIPLFAAIVWVVTAAVSSYSLIDCCRLSTYMVITAICMVSVELTYILRGVFQAGFKLSLHFSICLLHCLLLMTLYFMVELPSGIRRLILFQYMEDQLLKYIKYAADQAYSNLRTVDHLLMLAILVGHPEVAAEKQETNTEADSGLMELHRSTSEDKLLLKSARSDDVQRVEDSNRKTSSPRDRPECAGACGGLPLELIQTVEDPDTTERTGKDEFHNGDELQKLLKRTESSVSIDSLGLCQENVKLVEEIQNTDILNSEFNLPSRKHMKYETAQNICRIGESEHVGRDVSCPEFSSVYIDKISSVLVTSRTQQTPEFADQGHALKSFLSNKYMGKDFMTLEVGPTIKRNFHEMMVDDALHCSNKHDAEHKTESHNTDNVNGVTWPGSASEVSQQTEVELYTDGLHGKCAGSEEDTNEGEVTASGGQRNQIHNHSPVSVNPTQEIPDIGGLADPDKDVTEEKLLLNQGERQVVCQGDHRINLSQIQNCQNQIPTTVPDSTYSDSSSSNFHFDEEELPGQQSSSSDSSLPTSEPDVTKSGASLLTVRCKSEEHRARQDDCQRQSGIKQGTPLYFPSYDGEELAVVHPPPEYFDERLVVDILNPPKRKYQWQSKIYISGSFKDMMNFLLGIESAVDGSGVFLNRGLHMKYDDVTDPGQILSGKPNSQISPLCIDGGLLHYWKILQHSDEHRDMNMDIRTDTIYFDEKIELERFLNIRRRYEMYIDRQQDDAQILKIYGVTKSVEGGCQFVHVLYEHRKIVANISVFIAHDGRCCGARSTCQMFTVPKGSKVKAVLLRPEVEALKTMISVQHPHLKDNLYIKLRVAGCSWYPSPSTRLHCNCILQLVDSLSYKPRPDN